MPGYCHGEGPIPARCMLIAEKPGRHELALGRPFVGDTGGELDQILWRCGLGGRENFYITNLCKDKPTGPDWSVTDEDIVRNEPALKEELRKVKPEIIVTVGAVSSNYFLREEDEDYKSIHTIHAIPHRSDGRSRDGVIYFPTWHPAAGLHDDPSAYQYIYHDFHQLKKLLDGTPFPDRKDRYAGKEDYIEWTDQWPGAEALKQHIREHNHGWIALDTEGGVGDDWGMLSWSVRAGEGYVVRPIQRQCLQSLRDAIRELGLTVVLQYGLHDIDILRWMRVWEEGFIWRDTMVESYILRLEPQGLKEMAYRLCGMRMKKYQDVVSPYSMELQVEYLLKLAKIEWGEPEEIIKDKKTKIKITKPQGLNKRIWGILDDIERDKRGKNGEMVDIYSRWYSIYPEVRYSAENRFGNLPVANLSHAPLKETIWYSGRDADATGRVHLVLCDRLRVEGLWDTCEMDQECLPMVEEMQRVGIKGNATYFRQLAAKYTQQQGRIRHKIREMVGYSINPESPPDVRKILFRRLKLPEYKKTKTGKASTGQKAIEALKDEHPVVRMILEHRKIDKNKNSFAIPLAEAVENSENNRARTSIKYTRVESGRYSAEDPNLLAMPVRTELGKEIRDGFEAEERHLLGSWDLNQIEMRFMAHESGEPGMIRGYCTDPGYDVHLETAAAIFGKKPEDITKEERYGAKRTGFGVITGITGYGLLDQFRMEGITKYDKDDCDYFIKGWLDVRKRVKEYMSSCRAEAKRYGYVTESVGGRRRYLPGVYSRNPYIKEEALRQTHSHKISSGAQAIMKKGMILLKPQIEEIRERGKLNGSSKHIWWILQIHDELIFEFPEGQEKVLDVVIKAALCSAVRLKVPVLVGSSWNKKWGRLK